MTSKNMREDFLFMRNNFTTDGKWGLPLIRNQNIDTTNLGLIACSDTKSNDLEANKQLGVHFFVDDYRFSGIYNNPQKTLRKYSQYRFLLSPDFSAYADMNLWRQLENVAKNRWVGAYWQSKGLSVIPTISWGLAQSFDFCFDGVENNGIVAIGMIGCKKDRLRFMRGYNALLERVNPKQIICFGTPFPEMRGNILPIDYLNSRKKVG